MFVGCPCHSPLLTVCSTKNTHDFSYEQSADGKPRSTRKAAPKLALNSASGNTLSQSVEDDLDALVASAELSAVGEATTPKGGDVDNLDLSEWLGEPSSQPPRYSGGISGVGTPSGQSDTNSWKSLKQTPYEGGQEFGGSNEPSEGDWEASPQQSIKEERLPTHVEVSDDGGCPVDAKDVDAITVAALKERGIEVFTPVQVR